MDFYTGIIYKSMGFPMEYMPVLFAVPRFAGWMAHWNEFIMDPENKIVRPKQLYLGDRTRDYFDMHLRNLESDDMPKATYNKSLYDDKKNAIPN